MPRPSIDDLSAFVAVARARSFTRAAASLGLSPSALSHAMRGLEERLGVRLLARTTRSVTPTEAGERLLGVVGPRLDEIDAELASLNELRDKPAGTVRLTATEHAAESILWPALRRLLAAYPDIKAEIVIDYGLTDIVTERFDGGVRTGEQVARDMIAVRISPDFPFAVVAAPTYFEAKSRPKTPHDLTGHTCINLRLPAHGLYAWEFAKGDRELRVRVDGQLIFNGAGPILRAALDGAGVAYLPEGQVKSYLEDRRLERVLEDWCPPFPGYHLYYPSRRQLSPAFALLVDQLRYRKRPKG